LLRESRAVEFIKDKRRTTRPHVSKHR
jgi:hypothetical protein